ncbi:MAG TPA: matrixin family metalloprotease [Fimbriimonadaceae bacterium]|nr:matrixin family metalloprotease [Fimbriimonadaceae bacterium]HRJ97807.1 matrixin family metalloprotease [Fimbriimonadaceae bacterium]
MKKSFAISFSFAGLAAVGVLSSVLLTGGLGHSDPGCAIDGPTRTIRDKALYEKWYAFFSNEDGRQVDLGPAVACFADGTPQEVIDAFLAAMRNLENGAWPGEFGAQYQNSTRWTGSQGDPRMLRWSFVPDGLNIPNGIGEGAAPSNLFALMDAQYSGNRAVWISKFTAVFTRWSQLSGLTFQRVTAAGVDWDDGAAWGSSGSATRGDVRIAMKPIDGVNGVLAYNSYPQNGDMVIDGGDISRWGNSSNDYRNLRNVVSHEHGHGIGIAHVCPVANTKLMEPFLSTVFDGPQHDDIRSAQRHYGDPYEPDNTSATAKDLGTIEPGSPVTRGPVPSPNVNFGSVLSIDANGEQDWMKFTTTGARNVTVTVTPIGTSYGDNAQNTNCTQTATTNSLTIANLAVQLVGTDGATVLSTADTQAAGVAETISNFALGNAGTFFVRVYETNTPSQSQLYHITVSVTAGNSAPTLNPIGNKVGNEENLITFTATATDPNAGQTLTYSLIGAPAGATIHPTTGVFTWVPTEAQGPGAYPLTVRVTDNGTPNLSDEENITVTVNEVTKTISGIVTLGDYFGDPTTQQVTFQIRNVGSSSSLETYNVTLGTGGSFSFNLAGVLPAGVYDITAKGSHWLRARRSSVTISPTGASGQNFTLANGDVDEDNEVAIGDYAALSTAYGSEPGDPNWNANADLNGDGTVDIGDFAILSANFGMTGVD